jgi:ribosomal protein S18 acetylase RimI-like enzyme
MNREIKFKVRPFRIDNSPDVIRLWRTCDLIRRWNDPHKGIARKLRVNPEWFLVVVSGKQLIGSIMVGYEGHRGWINYLAVAPEFRCQGIGSQLMEEAEKILQGAGCAKINLLVRVENEPELSRFYQNLGFSLDRVACYGKRLKSDELPAEELPALRITALRQNRARRTARGSK